MTNVAQEVPSRSGIGGLIEAVRRVLVFRNRTPRVESVAPARAGSVRPGTDRTQRRLGDVHKLARDGMKPLEIARRTGLSQDTVAMLLNLGRVEAAESAAKGTFFRILQSRVAG